MESFHRKFMYFSSRLSDWGLSPQSLSHKRLHGLYGKYVGSGKYMSPQNKHGTWKWTLGKGDSYWKPPFPGSMLIFGGVWVPLVLAFTENFLEIQWTGLWLSLQRQGAWAAGGRTQNIRAVAQHEVEQGFFSVPKQLMSTISFCIHILHDRWQVRNLDLTLTEDNQSNIHFQVQSFPLEISCFHLAFSKSLGVWLHEWFSPILVVVKDHVPPSLTQQMTQHLTGWFWKMMFLILWAGYILVS